MKHFTLQDRKILSEYLQENITYEEIGKILQKSKSSVSDEINRNGGKKKYDPYRAERRAQLKKQQSQKRPKIEISPGLKEYVIQKIKEDWSPEQIAGELKSLAQKTILSHETIYQFIYSKEGKQLKLWKHLRHRKIPQRITHGTRKAQKNKMKIPHRNHITLRSMAAEKRTEPGHFEVDLMIFSKTKQVLAVFVDRCTRKTWAYINPDKTASAMADTIREFICDAGIANVHSLSFDNGTENFYHYMVRDEFGTFETFFCDPYCSWQKGTVENTNKLLRQYFPRDIEPADMNYFSLKNAISKLNNRPRKCLNFLTPNFCSV
jgi:IS30 family transposase